MKKPKESKMNPMMQKLTKWSTAASTLLSTVLMVLMSVMLVFILRPRHYVVLAGFGYTLWLLRGPARQPEGHGPRKKKIKCVVVLGSGGHTSEMLYSLSTLDWANYQPTYIVAETDTGSERKATSFERKMRRSEEEQAHVDYIPRPREVGQRYIKSIYSTISAFYQAVRIIFRVFPDVVFTNGPGTCVPVAVAAYLPRLLFLKHIKVVYSESFACVNHLSLSGKIVYHLSDLFFVQWEQLLVQYPKAIYAGRIRQVACYDPDEDTSSIPIKEPYALVTVGSTQFNGLIEAADTAGFILGLKRLELLDLRLQLGNGSYKPHNIMKYALGQLKYSYFEYDTDLPKMIARASLVIGHAGAGSIIDALSNRAKMVVVPNGSLMANHQSQLADELAKPEHRFVFSFSQEKLQDGIQKIYLEDLKPFPRSESQRFAVCVAYLVGWFNEAPPAPVRPASTSS